MGLLQLRSLEHVQSSPFSHICLLLSTIRKLIDIRETVHEIHIFKFTTNMPELLEKFQFRDVLLRTIQGIAASYKRISKELNIYPSTVAAIERLRLQVEKWYKPDIDRNSPALVIDRKYSIQMNLSSCFTCISVGEIDIEDTNSRECSV